MNFIEKLDWPTLLELIFKAEKRIFISSPGIDKEISEALIERNNSVRINVVLDNSEETIRHGYGEIQGIEALLKTKIGIKESKGNLVSFIIIDNEGYFLFPKSRIFSESPEGMNAVRIDPMTIELLIAHYFSPTDKIEKSTLPESSDDKITVIEYFNKCFNEIKSGESNPVSKNFEEENFNSIKQKLSKNPPLEPDLQRKINTYNAKIQFVELKFSGGNIQNTIAKLPPNALPLNSNDLKQLLQTRIKMFQDITNNTEYTNLQQFKEKVEKLRKAFLTPITCREGKSIIKMEDKENFKVELKKLNEEANNLNILLTGMLEEEKIKTTDLLRKELSDYLRTNEPEEVKLILKEDIKKRKMEEMISAIIVSIKFPEIKKLIENISLREYYYDLTWADFKDEKLLIEFVEKKIMDQEDIDSIVELKNAFSVKKES